MNWFGWLFSRQEFGAPVYSTEVLCSNWVARPLAQPDAPGGTTTLEQLHEADALTFLARIYACQRC